MAKWILMLVFVIILCNSISVAQNKKDEYDKLVDYVNLVYVKSYVEKKIQQKKSGFPLGYRNDYNANIKGKWEKVINKKGSFKLVDLLNDLKGHTNATLLCNLINDKKKNFRNEWKKAEIITDLVELPKDKPNNKDQGFFGFLKEATKELRDNLEKQIPDSLFETNRISPENIGIVSESERPTTRSNADRKHFSINELLGNVKSGFSFWKIIFVVLLAVLVYFGYNKRKYIKTFTKRFEPESNKTGDFNEGFYKKKVADLENENKRLKGIEKENSQLRLRNKQLEQLKIELERRIKEFDRQNTSSAKEQSQSAMVGKGEGQVMSNATHLYADAIIDGRFHQVTEQPNDDTVYELIRVSSARIAMFTIYREAYRRVIRNPDFADGCDKQKVNDEPQSLEMESGEAIMDDLGKWKVTKKAKIKFV